MEYWTHVKYMMQVGGIYLVWVLLHYGAAQLYIGYCTPATLWGFVLSPVIAPLPHCALLRWAIYQGGEMINIMWMLLSMLTMRLLTPP
jgi:hypothetical protein